MSAYDPFTRASAIWIDAQRGANPPRDPFEITAGRVFSEGAKTLLAAAVIVGIAAALWVLA